MSAGNNPLLNFWFLVVSISYLLIKITSRFGLHIPLVHDYLADICCVPVILSITLWFQQRVTLRNNLYRFKLWHILFAIGYISIIFEVVLPHYSRTYTSDVVDVLCYSLGGIIFWFTGNRKPEISGKH